jgi:hypothetical protein
MILKNRNIVLFFILVSTILFPLNFAYAQSTTTNITVQVNKTEIIHRSWVINTIGDKKGVKCNVYKPPDMFLTKKPKFGKVKFKKGVVIDNNELRGDDKKYCKDKVIRATIAEFTSDKKGKTSFKIQVLYRQGRYEEHIFGNYLFNVNVR